MGKMKEMFIFIRNGLAFSFSWLVICSMIVSYFSGQKFLSTAFLAKLLLLCLWGVIAFAVSFKNQKVQKKGFIFSLSLFYILFIPAEVAGFYLMGLFSTKGSFIQWAILGMVVIATYVASLLIDLLIMKKKAIDYTEKLNEYISR